MGAGIAQVCAQAGWKTNLFDPFPEGLERGRNAIDAFWEKGIARGKTTPEQKELWNSKLSFHSEMAQAVSEVDLVIEAVPEIPALKHSIFADLGKLTKESCILGTNTSSLSIKDIAQASGRPENVIGMHFFNPVPIMKLLELVEHDDCSERTITIAKSVGKTMGKTTILVKDVPGFATSRLGVVLGNEAIKMLADGVASAKDLDGATVCIQTGTTTELNLADFFRSNNISYEPVPIETNAEGQQQYLAGACDVYTTDASGLASTRATFESPDEHTLLPEIVSKEPLGPLVRHGDNEWGDTVRWTLNALITAEELGVTSANITEMSAGTNNPEINRLLGTEGTLGEMLGLNADWAMKAIAVSGNYGEIFEQNIGEATPIGLARGLNAQWTDGGLIYSPPFR
jgi:hypothetical protein